MTAGLAIARLKRLLRVPAPWSASVFAEACNCVFDRTIQASLGLIDIPVQFLVETGLPGWFTPTFSRLGLLKAPEAEDGQEQCRGELRHHIRRVRIDPK